MAGIMKEMQAMDVSVVMTCYNEGPYIGAAVRSVLDQSAAHRIAKIVIADDGSGQETLSVLRDIQNCDPRISVIFGEGGVGPAEQRNRAIAQTTTPLIAILDGDDIWSREKLELQLPLFESDGPTGLSYTGYFSFPNDDLTAARRATVVDLTRSKDLVAAYFLNDPPILPSTVIMRRSVFDICGGFDPSLRVFEETDLYLRMARYCRFSLLDEPLLYKRNRGTSITGGRKDLMAHHALVAFKAASEEPRLMPLVPIRLAERARKLANHRLLLGDRAGAQGLSRLAVRLDPFSYRAWLARLASSLLAGPLLSLASREFGERRRALGADQ
ncbi:glycosyltransferase family 2 protein [Methylolobus aquaticus]|nr:glycosyltransferase family 2 protein [Methylolobus aquaticus]